MKGMKKLWAYILVVAMIVTLTPVTFDTTNVKAATTTQGFHVSGSKLLDANGNPFIMRGINHAHTWFKDQTTTAIKAIANTGANTVRLVLSDGVQWNKDDLSTVKSLIKQCKDNKLIAVLEVHDATGKTSETDLLTAADYFVEMKDALIGNEAYVIVNIANEWFGTWETAAWKAGYVKAIKVLRDAGIQNTIMVDAAGWGQYPKSIAEGGKEVLAADPLANTMFSTHMYEYAGGTPSMVKDNIDAIAKTGLCQVIGEFGWKHTDGDVAEETIMSYCQQLGMGYMAWSWKGNSGGVEYLDLANDWAGTSLSDWGVEVVNGVNGLKETSKVCSVFTNGVVATSEAPATTASPILEPTDSPIPTTACPCISETPSETSIPSSNVPSNGINIFNGSISATSWTNVLELTTVKNGGTFDPSIITKDGYFRVEYTGDKDQFELVFQSWSGGAGWAEVRAAGSETVSNGNHVARIAYKDIVSVYGDKFSALDRLYVKTTNGSMELKKLCYIQQGTVTDSAAPSVVPTESVKPSESADPTASVKPSESVDPTESVKPSESVDPTESSKPVDFSNKVNFFTGSKEVSEWQTAVEVAAKKNGGEFDPAVITKDGYFTVTYTGTKDCLQVIFQSWSGGSGWAIVKPETIKTNGDGSYTAVLDYDIVTKAYGTSYDLLDRIYLQTQNGSITLKSFDYILGSTGVVESETPSVEPTKPVETTNTPESQEPGKTPEVSNQPGDGDLVANTFQATDANVKLIGRTYLNGKNERWLCNTASGIEFTFKGTKGSITILGDFLATGSQDTNKARFAIYVNDKLYADDMMDEESKTYDFYNGDVATVTVKVLKLSESASATIGIGAIDVTAIGGIQPTKALAHKIEFIGDSITCGYGVDDENINGGYKNATEDGTKTYAYKTAQTLGADYSMVSVSGIGVISNYSSAGVKNDENVMPKYYEKIGYSWSSFGDWSSPAKIDWDFAQYQPDAVVVNLGTNDSSYVAGDATRQAEFVEGYVDFIKKIRKNNPDATIFCTLGIMGADLYPQIEQAVTKYTAQTGDTNITSMQFDAQNMADGICVDWHPSEKTHTKAAAKLSAYIKEVMGW